MSTSEHVASILLEIQAVTLNPKNPFRYTSGILSPIYTDNRLLMSYPMQRKIVIDYLAKVVKKIGVPDVLAGTATAAIPHAAWLSDSLNVPMVYVRSKPKEHGKKSQVEGHISKGQSVIVVEDLVSTGKSSLGSVAALRSEGARVQDVVAIFNYELPSLQQQLKDAKVHLTALVTFRELVEVALEKNFLKKKDKDLVLSWANDPAGWEKNFNTSSG